MLRQDVIAFVAVAVSLAIVAVDGGSARAAGYWNMPGTWWQRTGHGYSGGYHAPLILGPMQCDGWRLGMPTRVPCAPSPYYGYQSCGDCGRMVEAPSAMEIAVPTAAPIPAPAPAPMPTAAAPVETPVVETVPVATSENVVQVADPDIQLPEPVAQPVVEPVRPLFVSPVQQ